MAGLTPPKYAAIFERRHEEAKKRELLTDFACWLLEGEFGEGREAAIVDDYLAGR